MSEHRTLLTYGCPIRLGRLAIVSREILYGKRQLYPYDKSVNGLALAERATSKEGRPSRIPKRIHQTYETMIIPNCCTHSMATWLDINPEYHYRYYTGEDCRDFIHRHFEPAVLLAYDTLYPGAYKADLWRYCVLYVEGGVYIDIKLFPRAKLEEIINGEADLLLTTDLSFNNSKEPAIYNAFMAAVPGHPLLKIFIDAVVDNALHRRPGRDLEITGPDLLGRLLSEQKIKLLHHPGLYTTPMGRIQTLSLRIVIANFESAIVDEAGHPVVERRNPHYPKYNYAAFQRTSGKPAYHALNQQGLAYVPLSS